MADRKFVTHMNRPILLVVVGPTAVGKTALAIQLAQHFHTHVVSADSRQVFKEMEIGTAKPSADELARVPHHFINTRSIADDYDAGSYAEEARQVLVDLFREHDQVVLCGGSGLYIRALLEGFDQMPEVPSSVRAGISKEYGERGLEWLQVEVQKADPVYYDGVDRKNPQRLMRALEVIRHTGQPFSDFHRKESVALPWEVIKIGLTMDREELYRRIDQRMDEMIENGLFEEATRLFSQRHLSALQTVGYQEIFGFLEGHYDREEAVRLLKRNSRNYAKRQLTWFRKDKSIHWFSPDNWPGILAQCSPSMPVS